MRPVKGLKNRTQGKARQSCRFYRWVVGLAASTGWNEALEGVPSAEHVPGPSRRRLFGAVPSPGQDKRQRANKSGPK